MEKQEYYFSNKRTVSGFIGWSLMLAVSIAFGIWIHHRIWASMDRSMGQYISSLMHYPAELLPTIATAILIVAALRGLCRTYRCHKKITSGEAAVIIDSRGIADNTGIFNARLIKWHDVKKIIVEREVNVHYTAEDSFWFSIVYNSIDEINARWENVLDEIKDESAKSYLSSHMPFLAHSINQDHINIQIHVSNPEYYMQNAAAKEQKTLSKNYKQCGTPIVIISGLLKCDNRKLAVDVYNAFNEYGYQQ